MVTWTNGTSKAAAARSDTDMARRYGISERMQHRKLSAHRKATRAAGQQECFETRALDVPPRTPLRRALRWANITYWVRRLCGGGEHRVTAAARSLGAYRSGSLKKKTLAA